MLISEYLEVSTEPGTVALVSFSVDGIVDSDSYEIINEDILENGGLLSRQL